MIALLMATAMAGDGPWTLNPGETNVYVGLNAYRYGRFNDGETNDRVLGSSLSSIGATAVLTRGLARGVEVEVRLPYERVRANAPESEMCTTEAMRDDWCEASEGIGDIVAIGKFRLLDENNLRPLSISLAGVFRTGETYSEKRGRLTNLGDGQTDVGLMASVGRSGTLGQGWYQAGLTGAYLYRFAHSNDGMKIPADEVDVDLTALLAPKGWFSIGPAASGFFKLGGVNVMEADMTTLDGFSSLRASQIKVGGKLAVYSEDGITLSVGAYRAVWARNNPIDTTAISVGIGWFRKPKVKEEAPEA